jgi:histidinol-phosphate/aromatic aminotransferase/cobyric acid decarboxylase-like protein
VAQTTRDEDGVTGLEPAAGAVLEFQLDPTFQRVDELTFAHAFVPLFKQDAPLLLPDITCFYLAYCRLFGIQAETVPLDSALRIRIADYAHPAGAINIPNPNAPTGIALSRAVITALLETHPEQPVVVDEAYVDFGAETVIPLVASHPNLLVVRTMSKSRALVGLRVGYAIVDSGLIEALARVKDSFNSLTRLARLPKPERLRHWKMKRTSSEAERW